MMLKRSFLLSHFLLFFSMTHAAFERLLVYKKDNFEFDFGVDYKGEGFYTKNAHFFSGSPFDQWFYLQSTWDFNTHARFGDTIKSKLTLRNKARWGTVRSILASTEHIQFVDMLLEDHNHGFNRLIPWIRKAWAKVSLNDAFGIEAERRHYFKFGAFPYEVGRGISLGSAYAISPGVLGFFADNTIDQYAFGLLLRGDLTANHMFTYDVYYALLENYSASFNRTTDVMFTKCLNCPSKYRGFGDINFLLVGRLLFTFFDNPEHGKLTFEPYIVYDRIPQHKVEFYGDADVKLATAGAAIEYVGPKFELGTEAAFNIGRQVVKAWDRNEIKPHRNATTAAIEEVYNQIFVGEKDSTGSNKALVTDTNKEIVEASSTGSMFNNKEIGTSGLYNGPYRFRPEYRNKLAGYMFVADVSYWMVPEELKASVAIGFASGDEHPNINLDEPSDTEQTETFGGFIGLQEIYCGKRVRSIFVIGGQSITRPLSSPRLEVIRDRQQYAFDVDGFTNLIYTGASLKWTPQGYRRKIMFNPNILYYWQDYPSNKYCLACMGSEESKSLDSKASKALGLELNLFFEVNWLENFKGVFAGAIFVPGKHFEDIIGKPTNLNQYSEVTRSDRCGIDYNAYPLVNKKTAFVLNAGFEYLF